jgi:hypothetical protein
VFKNKINQKMEPYLIPNVVLKQLSFEQVRMDLV